jgi:hypothetical protein
MAQGQVISALVRGYLATSRDRYRTAAESALNILDPKLSPAIAVQYKGGLVYEELPGGKNEKVLNGWIFTLFGLYDYFKCFGSDRAELLFRDSEFALRRQLMDYDTGYWSLYDQSGNMASPFYHQLHILLMKAMSGITGENGYLNMAEVWGAYQESSLFRYRSLVVKSVQKLLETKHLEIVE